MADDHVLSAVAGVMGRQGKALLKAARGISYAPRRNTPESVQRANRPALSPVRPLVDPVLTLGHAPRPRTGRGVGRWAHR